MNVRVSPTHASSNEAQWHYPDYPGDPAPPPGRKLQILTVGGVSIYGQWGGKKAGHIAWAYLIQRDQTKEDWLKEHNK